MVVKVTRKKVLILGASGMLGHEVLEVLSSGDFEVLGTVRNAGKRTQRSSAQFDAESDSIGDFLEDIRPDWVINCIGIIKPYIDEQDPNSVERAININSVFPRKLALAAESSAARVIQIATDCVFSGLAGDYSIDSAHDAQDVYGKSKSLGEVRHPSVHHVRTSIIGRELNRSTSLVEWVLGQPLGETLNGFSNHYWNGVTTTAFARVAAGIIRGDISVSAFHHLTPLLPLTKFELLNLIAKHSGRTDLRIVPFEAEYPIDRTLSTGDSGANDKLWSSAGYASTPSIDELVEEMFAEYSART